MPSYVITGVARGLGWEFLNQLSSDGRNTVIGIVRNKAATEKRVAEELSERSNISILEADITNYDALKKAASEAATITGGALDYLIANAAHLTTWDSFDGIGTLGSKPDELSDVFRTFMDTNVLANIHLYNLFMPQILKGQGKKVIVISSGHADTDFVNEFDIEVASLYSASKAAMNMITAKFNAQYKQQGVLFLSICPGMVETGGFNNVTPEQMEGLGAMLAKFKAYAPHFNGPDTPPDSIRAVLSVIEKSSIEGGNGGAFLSHYGNRQWL